jgi:RimJ/RimL family protein N-acetyltransferase
LEAFAGLILQREFAINRLICVRESAVGMDTALRTQFPPWKKINHLFPEKAMVLYPAQIAALEEPQLCLAEPGEEEEIALGSVAAMEEELGLVTPPHEMERLIRSKLELIRRHRYYLLRDSPSAHPLVGSEALHPHPKKGKIIFQAFLSTVLPEVGLIQGVWVPKSHRNHGIATRCMAEICKRAFLSSEHLLLRVQERNLPAVRAYRKVGFQEQMEYLSIWYT